MSRKFSSLFDRALRDLTGLGPEEQGPGMSLEDYRCVVATMQRELSSPNPDIKQLRICQQIIAEEPLPMERELLGVPMNAVWGTA